MRARAGMVGDDIVIASQPGQGTLITLRLPVSGARTHGRRTVQMDGDRHPDSI
jgi:hypothetical protein